MPDLPLPLAPQPRPALPARSIVRPRNGGARTATRGVSAGVIRVDLSCQDDPYGMHPPKTAGYFGLSLAAGYFGLSLAAGYFGLSLAAGYCR